MRWASAISDDSLLATAVTNAAKQIAIALDGAKPSLVLAFLSPHYQSYYSDVPGEVARAFPGALLVGCTGGGIIGAGKEIENRRAVSLIAAELPGVILTPFHVDTSDIRSFELKAKDPQFIVLPDPFTFDAGAFLSGLDKTFPGAKKIGGLASGGRIPGANALVLRDQVYRTGAVRS